MFLSVSCPVWRASIYSGVRGQGVRERRYCRLYISRTADICTLGGKRRVKGKIFKLSAASRNCDFKENVTREMRLQGKCDFQGIVTSQEMRLPRICYFLITSEGPSVEYFNVCIF